MIFLPPHPVNVKHLGKYLRLSKEFFNRHSTAVAKDLLGKVLIFNDVKGLITETEAYRGSDDEASHAYLGPTIRSSIMFGDPGYSYVYLIYGMYHCLNIVTEELGKPGAVLIRGLKTHNTHLNGPGKICKYLGITKTHHGINLISNESFYLVDNNVNNITYKTTPRIGIKKATDKLWRFVITT